jgi:outer membrane biosynthesis protein TonB
MWPWQRNGEQPNRVLIRRLLAVSSVGHIFLLMFVFVFYHDDASNVSRDVIAVLLDMDVTIVKVPFRKVVNKTVPVIGSKRATAPASKEPAKKAAPPETAIISKPKIQPKTGLAKTKKALPKPVAKKELPKPKVPEPPKVVKPQPKKIEEQKPEIKKEIKEEPPIKESPASTQDIPIDQQEVPLGENVVYVGQHEYEALEIQRQIQEEAERCWKAPPGISCDVGCQIVVHIGHDGVVRDITVGQKSGVLMYDVHARQAVSQMTFPRGSWGKEVVVYFKQS